MPVNTLVLHIGTAKTGSTTTQSTLYRHRSELLGHGIAYLHGRDQPNSRDLAAACVGPDGDDDLLDHLALTTIDQRLAYHDSVTAQLRADVAALPAEVHTLVMSSEHFHSRLITPTMIKRLGDVVRPLADDVQVICYLRPQVDLAASFYSTYLRNGGCESFDEAGRRILRVDHPYADYDLLLRLWSEEFGAAAVRPRIFGEFVGGNLATDIAAVIGAPEGLFDAQQIAAENPSISRVGQALIVAINRVLASGIHDETLIHARSRIATAFGGPGERWSEQEAALRQAPFEAGNEAVRRQWFPDRSALFGPRPEPAEPNTTTEHIDVLVDVLSELSKRSGHA